VTDRVYIHPLREGSDDCWDGFSWRGCDFFRACYGKLIPSPRPCAVWTGTADRDTLAHLMGEA